MTFYFLNSNLLEINNYSYKTFSTLEFVSSLIIDSNSRDSALDTTFAFSILYRTNNKLNIDKYYDALIRRKFSLFVNKIIRLI